jgi:hypothetical protein
MDVGNWQRVSMGNKLVGFIAVIRTAVFSKMLFTLLMSLEMHLLLAAA